MAGGFPYTDDFDRLIELYDVDGTTLVRTLFSISGGQREVTDASFQWLRLGGCGQGSISLDTAFDAEILQTGQWIKMSYKAGQPWYFGRVESWSADAPVGVTVQLYGPLSVLAEIQVGGQGDWDTRLPHTYAKGDYFTHDPDHSMQSFDAIQDYSSLIQKIHAQYIAPYRSGLFPLGSFSAPTTEIDFTSITFRGEESLAQILRSVSDMCYGASYGIDAEGNFFFIPRDETTQASYIEDADLQSISRTEDRSLMYNRMILVGGYIYGERSQAGFYRWVSTHFDTASMDTYGAKQLRVYLPWVRTPSEATNYASGFFEKYAGPTTRYTVSTVAQGAPLYPWSGFVELLPRTGYTWGAETSVVDVVEQVDVSFNEMPTFTFTTGPEELQYPQEPEAQRWEMPDENGGGGDLSNISDNFSGIFSFSGSGSAGSSGESYVTPNYSFPSENASDYTSALASDFPSDNQSNFPSAENSDFPSDGQSNFPSENASNFPSELASNFPSDDQSNFPSDNASNYPSDNASNFPSGNASNFPSDNASNYPSDNASNFPSENASNFPSDNASNFPSDNASNFPSENASNFPSDNASNFPSDDASNFPSDNASNFPSEDASNFPSENQSNFPSSDASNYPSSDASNYPSFGSNLPSSAEGGSSSTDPCGQFVCDVTVDGCTITVSKSTAAEAGTKLAAAMEDSPVLAARIAQAIQPYL